MWQERTIQMLGNEAVQKLADSHVAVFGLGGVGSYTMEALVRAGVGKLTLIDGDLVADTNLNRQLIATRHTIGMEKSLAAQKRALSVNPDCKVTPLSMFYGLDNADCIDFSAFDYVADCIDTVSSKLLIIERCKHTGTPVISCMGAGNKLDPTRFQVADIAKTSVCPLARVMRRELRTRGIEHVKVVYSTEPPISNSRTPGSVSFVPGAAGLVLAGEILRDLTHGITKSLPQQQDDLSKA